MQAFVPVQEAVRAEVRPQPGSPITTDTITLCTAPESRRLPWEHRWEATSQRANAATATRLIWAATLAQATTIVDRSLDYYAARRCLCERTTIPGAMASEQMAAIPERSRSVARIAPVTAADHAVRAPTLLLQRAATSVDLEFDRSATGAITTSIEPEAQRGAWLLPVHQAAFDALHANLPTCSRVTGYLDVRVATPRICLTDVSLIEGIDVSTRPFRSRLNLLHTCCGCWSSELITVAPYMDAPADRHRVAQILATNPMELPDANVARIDLRQASAQHAGVEQVIISPSLQFHLA